MGYVIYLNTEPPYSRTGRVGNAYGYWTGKSYAFQGEFYPVCDNKINSQTKVYKSKKRATTAAEKAYMKFGYVASCEVEEV
ncbi:MAG: hypothetical protein E7215_17005 [Clostridium sulfidigenes]|uniref:Uncharacterized protein n=1 Tax=Clostridium sulfidigenes TaxID=318464 RepID=A0A927ZNE1_9CLOT|nr:hypothetical protein [Clostridium sulfidigenes]